MALIACPECGREVSNRAPTCVQCGCPIAGASSREGRQVEPQQARQVEPQRVVHQQTGSVGTGFGGGFGCVLGVIAAVILLVVVLAGFSAAAKCGNCNGTGRVLGGLMECPQCKGRGVFGK